MTSSNRVDVEVGSGLGEGVGVSVGSGVGVRVIVGDGATVFVGMTVGVASLSRHRLREGVYMIITGSKK